MLKRTHGRFFLVTALALLVTLLAAAPCAAAQAGTDKRPKLVKHVEKQKYNKETKNWELVNSWDYKYNKKRDPIQVDWYSYTGYGYSSKKLSYTYRKNGKRKYAKYTKTSREWHGLGGAYIDYTEKGTEYYNKKGKKTKVKYKYKGTYEDGSNAGSNSDSKKFKYKKACFYSNNYDDYKYKLKTRKKGILKKVLYIEPGYGNKWDTLYKFNKKGLMWNRSYKYTYDKKTGLVKSVKYSACSEKYRTVFIYSNRTTDKVRYNGMINSFMDSEHFIWY